MSEAARQTAKEETSTAKAYAAQSASSGLTAFNIRRRAVRPRDVQIEILYCGVCHSDLHQVRNEWQGDMPTVYPCVPGHEIIGRVVKAGSAEEIQGRRHCRRGLHGGFRPHLPRLPER